jgi:hypothetical protein
VTLSDLVRAVQDETCCDDAVLIETMARRAWPDIQDFKPVQVRLMAGLIERRQTPQT